MTGPRTINDRALTLDRGLQILKLLASSDQDLSVAAVARAAGLHRQAVYRLLGTLEEHSLVVRSSTGRYRIGLGTLGLAGPSVTRLQEAVRPSLRQLAKNCRSTAFLAAREGNEVVALLVVEPLTTDFHIAYRMGARLPITKGAGGQAILSGLEPGEFETEEIAAARAAGVAVTRAHITLGAIGVAAPIRLRSAEASDASVGVVTLMDVADLDRMKEAVVTAARKIDRVLWADTLSN